ncbi:hypothetical protein MKW98_021815, partial [Papaver atlanticum]
MDVADAILRLSYEDRFEEVPCKKASRSRIWNSDSSSRLGSMSIGGSTSNRNAGGNFVKSDHFASSVEAVHLKYKLKTFPDEDPPAIFSLFEGIEYPRLHIRSESEGWWWLLELVPEEPLINIVPGTFPPEDFDQDIDEY